MHIKDNLTNFLYDKKYYVALYDNYLYVFNYVNLDLLTNKSIILKLENFKLIIKGQNLFISRLLPQEILIKGKIDSIGIDYE